MRWTIKPQPDEHKVKSLQNSLGIDEKLCRLLVQRGIETYDEARRFFRPNIEHLHDPFLMKDMDVAVVRIEKAIANGERIMVYGDYDVDGTTSVALMSTYLESRISEVATYIPDRYSEGYGVSFKGIDFAADNDVSLIISLDCGIKDGEKIQYASDLGIDFIVCDHHRPAEVLPPAVAVLDPQRTDCNYPYKELCGCGVGFKLIQALHFRNNGAIQELMPFLDLVATAIAADIVPITGENRVLAYLGLQVINSSPRTGLKALINNVKKEELNITDVVFIIAPRINAAGRMKHGQYAVTLLKESNSILAEQYAAEIDQFNSDRREADQKITEEALALISTLNEEEKYTSVVYNENWHKGVIGIVASRLTETYYRPTLVFTKSGDKLAASARSISGFDVYNAIEACSEYLEQFGGHKYAAGLTLLEQQYENFKNAFEKVVSETLDKSLMTPEIKVDCELDIEEINPKFYRILKQFAPFGPGNMTPVFLTNGLCDTGYGKCVGEDKSHLRVVVKQQDSPAITAIGFGLGNKIDFIENRQEFSAVYSIDENEWNGNTSLQLKLRDIKPTLDE